MQSVKIKEKESKALSKKHLLLNARKTDKIFDADQENLLFEICYGNTLDSAFLLKEFPSESRRCKKLENVENTLLTENKLNQISVLMTNILRTFELNKKR